MMKIHPKKNASLEDETVLVQLERRHTLKEDANETDSGNLRKTIRANSLDNLGEGHSSTDVEAVTAEKPSNFTRKPTVITESELSSSRLYKNRKAKINSDGESVEDLEPAMPHEDLEDLEPKTLNDPKLKPSPVSNQCSRKPSSCCWYFTIILVICVACLVVIIGVGGIVYMEYFAIYKEKDIENNKVSEKNNPSASKGNFQHTTYKQYDNHRNEPTIPENILKDIIQNSTIKENIDLERKIAPSQQKDIFPIKDQTDSKNTKVEKIDIVKNGLVSENQDMKVSEDSKTFEYSDVSRNIHARFNHFIVPVSDKSVELKLNPENQDSVDLNLNLQSVDDIMDKTPDERVDKVNEQMTGSGSIIIEKSNSNADVLDSKKESLVSERNFNFETTTLQGIELKDEQVKVNISFRTLPELHLLPDNSLNHMENSINDNHADSSFDLRTLAVDHDPEDNFFDHGKHAIDHDSEDDSFNLQPEPSINHSPKNNSLNHAEHTVIFKDKSLNDSDEDSSDFDSDNSSSDEHSKVGDKNQNSDDSSQLVFLRPVVESKAVPIPLAFLRRIGFDIKNPDSYEPMSAQDMDVKFSLAEALKYLRSLDTESNLPVSREKTLPQKTSNQKGSKETKLPIKSEREEYLKLLRKHIFEESS